MDNQVMITIVKTTLTGTIEGENIIIIFDNEVGILPLCVNALCLLSIDNEVVGTVTVYGEQGKNNVIRLSGKGSEATAALLAGMESAVQTVLKNG